MAFNTNGVSFTVAIDSMEQCIRLPASEDGQTISVDEANSTGIATVGSVVVFDYDPSVFLSQPKATSILNVNPYEVYSWIGSMSLTPLEDFWTDYLQMPTIDSNYDEQMNWINAQNAELARQAVWGAWNLTSGRMWDDSVETLAAQDGKMFLLPIIQAITWTEREHEQEQQHR